MKYEKPGGMKKILFFLLLLFCIPFSSYGIFGDGSLGSPYSGPLTTNMTWSGTVYVNGDVTVDGFTLTISPGAIIVFLASGTDIIITGTGVLTASGSAGSMIRFTADFNNNGIYGEPGETWGHISFQNMTSGFTTPSIIDNCIIEYGKKNPAPHDVDSFGGGIVTTFTYLTISNSIIRNNYAGWGGGICVYSNAFPSISNCIITNNTAGTTGGGLLLDQNPFSRVDNCVIMKNTCSGEGGAGGVFVGDNSTNVTFYNCTIVSNISSLGRGDNIRLYENPGSTRPKFYNTIVWGSGNSIYYSANQNPLASDFNNCAIQGYSTGYTNCISLSGTNTDPTGPNFYNITEGSEDYRINYISPCRDAGTSTGAPATDILGNSRVGPYDIGAYEVQYSSWTGTTSTDWATATNWASNIVPTSGSSDVIIPTGLTNYPIGSSAPDFTIGLGKMMLLNPGAKATLGTLINNGTLTLGSDASNISSLIVTTFSGNDASIELFLTGGNPGAPTLKLNKWHFISTPVSILPVSTFAPTFTLNVVGWYDNQVSGTLATGWIAYDGYRYSTGGSGGPTFSNLTPGNGYDYYATTDQKYTFSGQLNTSNVTMSLSNIVNDALHGFNLLGNPFSSGLNWDDIINSTYSAFPANTSKSLYFTRDNAQCSYIGGVGIPSDVTGIIPPMQGFFVKTYSAGNTITIPAGARYQVGIHPRYKGFEIIPLVRLSLAEGTLTDETVVRFDAAAKSGVDYDFDAPKMFLSPDVLSIYSTSEGSNFAINGLPFPATFVEVPVVVNLTAAGNHTISATQLQGLDNYDVTLTDNTTGFVANLKTTPVLTFEGTTGTTADRFILKVGTITTKVENPIVSKNIFNIFPANNMINIQTTSDAWDGKSGSVRVLDLTGRTIEDLNNSEFNKNSLIQVAAPGAKGIYVVEIKSGVMKYVGKVVIK
jgi:hypothetical protein